MDSHSIQICRLCLQTSNDMVNIWGEYQNSTIASILEKHFWFQIHKSDGISEWLCQICWIQVRSFHHFYERIHFLHGYNPNTSTDALNFVVIKEEQVADDDATGEFDEPDLSLVKHEQIDLSVQATDLLMSRDGNSFNDEKVEYPAHLLSIEDSRRPKDDKSIFHIREVKTKVKRTTLSDDEKERSLYDPSEEEMSQIRELFTMQCDICSDFKYESLSAARRHYRKVHKVKGYLMCCGKKFFRRIFILGHLQTHLNPTGKYECDYCKKCYTTKQILHNHMHNHMPIDTWTHECTMCPLKFAKKTLLTRHLNSKHPSASGETFACNKCNKTYRTKILLGHHTRSVHEYSLDFICDICASRFKRNSDLRLHRNRHHSSNPTIPQSQLHKTQCDLCGVWVKNKSQHVKRMHQSSAVDVAKCSMCTKVAKSKSALDSHMRNVHGERRHQCVLCDKAFKCAKNLKEHIAWHTGEYLYDCPYCEKKFKSNANMHSHRKKAHLTEWTRDSKANSLNLKR